jgi:hypothetical protein
MRPRAVPFPALRTRCVAGVGALLRGAVTPQLASQPGHQAQTPSTAVTCTPPPTTKLTLPPAGHRFHVMMKWTCTQAPTPSTQPAHPCGNTQPASPPRTPPRAAGGAERAVQRTRQTKLWGGRRAQALPERYAYRLQMFAAGSITRPRGQQRAQSTRRATEHTLDLEQDSKTAHCRARPHPHAQRSKSADRRPARQTAPKGLPPCTHAQTHTHTHTHMHTRARTHRHHPAPLRLCVLCALRPQLCCCSGLGAAALLAGDLLEAVTGDRRGGRR